MNYEDFVQVTQERFTETVKKLNATKETEWCTSTYYLGSKIIGETYFSFAEGKDVYYLHKELLKMNRLTRKSNGKDYCIYCACIEKENEIFEKNQELLSP